MLFIEIVVGVGLIYGVSAYFSDEEGNQKTIFVKAAAVFFCISFLLGAGLIVGGAGHFESDSSINFSNFMKVFIVSIILGLACGLKAVFPDIS